MNDYNHAEFINHAALVINDEIDISEEHFSFLKETFSQEEIIDAISKTIDEFDIPMPLRQISYDEAVESFKALCAYDALAELQNDGPTYSRYPYNYAMIDEYIGQSRIGNISSDYFHQERRFHCDSINAPSPYRSWTIEKFRVGFLRALFSMKFATVNARTLRSAIGLRKYIASQFKPSVAKYVYQQFDSKHVLDFSSGWGDRLAGFYATDGTVSYTGIDPNATLTDGYNAQMDMYGGLTTGKTAMIHCGTAEDVLPTLDQSFDTVFTSPPYFNIERYTQLDNQSWKKYRKIDDWLSEFLNPVLAESWRMLQSGGCMIINISDVYSNHRINQICDPMNDIISQFDDAEYIGGLGMKLSKRPNSKAVAQDGIFVEPMWVFHKA